MAIMINNKSKVYQGVYKVLGKQSGCELRKKCWVTAKKWAKRVKINVAVKTFSDFIPNTQQWNFFQVYMTSALSCWQLSCFEYLFWDTAQLTIFLIVVIWITANCKEIFSIFSPLISFMEFCLFEEHARNAIAINIMGCYFSYHHGQENQHYALSCVLCDTRLYSKQVRRRKSWDENYFCLN